jgi:hypothetical protein
MSEQSDNRAVVANAVSETTGPSGGADRRVHARAPFIAAAEVCELQSKMCLTGRCSDLSAGGCYVDTLAPLAVGAEVAVRIVHESREFQALARVAYSSAPMGMGLTFTKITPEHEAVLRSWTAALNVESPPRPTPPTEPVAGPARDGADIKFVLNQLITLLIRKKILTEQEATELLRQMFQ